MSENVRKTTNNTMNFQKIDAPSLQYCSSLPHNVKVSFYEIYTFVLKFSQNYCFLRIFLYPFFHSLVMTRRKPLSKEVVASLREQVLNGKSKSQGGFKKMIFSEKIMILFHFFTFGGTDPVSRSITLLLY